MKWISNGKIAGARLPSTLASRWLLAADAAAGNGGDSERRLQLLRRRPTVTFIPKNLGNPYFDTSDAGGKKAVRSSAATTRRSVRRTAARTRRSQYIDTEAQKHTKAIVLSANDPKALCDSLSKRRRPAPRWSPSTPTPSPDCRDVFVNQATADGIAKVEVDMIADADRRLGRDRDPLGGGQRDQPERVDRHR